MALLLKCKWSKKGNRSRHTEVSKCSINGSNTALAWISVLWVVSAQSLSDFKSITGEWNLKPLEAKSNINKSAAMTVMTSFETGHPNCCRIISKYRLGRIFEHWAIWLKKKSRYGDGSGLQVHQHADVWGHEEVLLCCWNPARAFCLSYLTETMMKTSNVTPWIPARRKK